MGALQEGKDPHSASPGKASPSEQRNILLWGSGEPAGVGKMFPPPRMFKLGDQQASAVSRLGPHLVIRGAQEIVPSGMQAEACHGALMGPNDLHTRGIRDRPNPDSSIWRGRKHQLLKGEQKRRTITILQKGAGDGHNPNNCYSFSPVLPTDVHPRNDA